MLCAERILTTNGMVEELINKFYDGRNYLMKELDKNGYKHKGEAGNFIFIKSKTDPHRVTDWLKNEKRILIKTYSNIGEFGTCLRVTIGERTYMQQFMEALLEADK